MGILAMILAVVAYALWVIFSALIGLSVYLFVNSHRHKENRVSLIISGCLCVAFALLPLYGSIQVLQLLWTLMHTQFH